MKNTKFLQFILLTAFLLIGFSCGKDDDPIDLTDVVDLTGEPNEVIENVSGTLFYAKQYGMWGIRYYAPGRIDGMGIYLIEKAAVHNVPLIVGAKIQLSGSCYMIPHSLVRDLIESETIAGTDVFYVVVSKLTN